MTAVSYDTVEILDTFARRSGITFPLLADPEYRIIDAFGIVNTDVPKDSPYFGFAYAGYYLVDAEGRVVEKHFGEENNDRSTASRILVRRFGTDAESQGQTETDHLALRWSSSNSELRPGQRTTLVLDVRLPEGMHVYSPGVEGYIPIAWDLDSVEGIELDAAEYPEAKIEHLPAIDESVPVYEGELRIVRDIRLLGGRGLPEALADRDELVIEGTFRYQACDADECFFPQTVPTVFTFSLGEHDLERVPETLRRVDESD